MADNAREQSVTNWPQYLHTVVVIIIMITIITVIRNGIV